MPRPDTYRLARTRLARLGITQQFIHVLPRFAVPRLARHNSSQHFPPQPRPNTPRPDWLDRTRYAQPRQNMPRLAQVRTVRTARTRPDASNQNGSRLAVTSLDLCERNLTGQAATAETGPALTQHAVTCTNLTRQGNDMTASTHLAVTNRNLPDRSSTRADCPVKPGHI